ncbi:C-Jun-amino-terminal kinase-interacting protein 1-like [Clytia hemisphaerica]|uniref:SH3 domain-containing protein n=1 Tax=Clytia hemisphaerica TaxID=252671 RepID=A0A7M5V9W1_9CNID
MLNPAAEAIQREKTDSNEDIKKIPHSKVEKKTSKSKSGDSNGVLRKIKSPKLGKRMLPDAPSLKPAKASLSKSSDDLLSVNKTDDENKSATIMGKYKYNSLPRKNKKEKSRNGSMSTFYLDSNSTGKVSKSPKLDRKDISSSNQSSLNNSPLMLKKKVSHTGSNPDLKKDLSSKVEIVNTNNFDKQTHIALYKFHARHKDEISFNDGDPIQVLKCFEDLWYEGINLLTSKQGVFPSRYVADILSAEMITSIEDDSDHRQFHMRFLGSVEVNNHKGDEILCFAIAKVVNQRSMLSSSNPPTCVLQVSSKGLRICNLDDNTSVNQDQTQVGAERKPKKGKQVDITANEEGDVAYFFSLKNVTYCGNHPKDRRYFGFITKHPDDHRFACHIFMSKFSTDNIAKLIGDCFKKYYSTYLDYRAPIEDLYIE